MDIACEGLIDRRTEASDEVMSVQAGVRIYMRAAHHAVRARPHFVTPSFEREPGDISAVVLHQTAGTTFLAGRDPAPGSSADLEHRSRDDHRIDRIAAHFVALQDGSLYYTHDIQYIMQNAGGRYGIDIEVAGIFSNRREPPTDGMRLSVEAIRAIRRLLAALRNALPSLTHIHPHGQVQTRTRIERSGAPDVWVDCGRDTGVECGKVDSCPGPDIWVNCGEWARDNLGLSTEPRVGRYQDNGISPRQSNPNYNQHVVG